MAWRTILANAMLSLGLLFCGTAHAQDSITDMLSRERMGVIDPGSYMAGDSVGFAIQNLGSNFLMRFDGAPEVFVLYAGRASMGGRILRYDDGQTAIQVTVWGGVTLYTDAKPGGLPAARTGDASSFALTGISLADLQTAAADDAKRLGYGRKLRLAITMDWTALAGDSGLRALYYDAMENAVRGIDRFAASAHAREALAKKVNTVAIVPAPRPTVNVQGRTLQVTFNPGAGYVGRASSRAIARGLMKLFGVH
ncbi:MAG TPA: DUF4908 domain-containing protein [Rhizomicrobium sp.]|jgi:hypothetical protein